MKKTHTDNFTPDLFSDNKGNIKKDVFTVNNGIVTFGKHEGHSIGELINDVSYCQWLLAQSWFKEKYLTIYNIVINNVGVPNDTPEHNRLQIRFTDDTYCMALAKLCNWKIMTKNSCIRNIQKAINTLKRDNFSSNRNNFDKIEELNMQLEGMKEVSYIKNGIEYSSYSGEPLFSIKKIFEEGGWDVIIQNDDENQNTYCKTDCLAYYNCTIRSDKIAVEIKPTLGDDYSIILREMKNFKFRTDYQCLVYEKFTSVVATLEDIKIAFATSDIKIFSFDEIDKAKEELLLLNNQTKEED